jgi:glucose-6-phosphate isomerase
MIKLNTSNTPKFPNKDKLLVPYLDQIKKRNQAFRTCLDDKVTITEIKKFAASVKGKYDHIVVLGIGGSALGTICLEQSLTHLFKKTTPRLYVSDNIDPTLTKELEDTIELKKTLFIVATKSGTTPETMGQYLYFRKKIESARLPVHKHFVFVTNPTTGTLREIANEESIQTFDVPENISSRFAVLTAIGLLPAALIGINIEKLIEGAKLGRKNFLSKSPKQNLAFQLANIQHNLARKGKSINVLMPYAQKLIRFADWYRQLLAESTGKEGKGLTPITALGATDQHSQLQLYNDGPNDKLIIFIEVDDLGPQIRIPNPLHKNLTFNQLIKIEKKATEQSLTKNGCPNLTITIPKITPETLGELIFMLEGSIAFLGEFFNINAFDQPGVELSKKLTKEAILKL